MYCTKVEKKGEACVEARPLLERISPEVLK